MKKLALCAVVCLIGLGCGGHSVPVEQLQAIQSREYQQSADVVREGVAVGFQNMGYSIKSIDGPLMTAEGQADGGMNWLGTTTTIQTIATAYISQDGPPTRVRLNLVTTWKKSTAYGSDGREDYQAIDQYSYDQVFAQIDRAIRMSISK